MTEAQVIDSINKVVNILAPKFKFGYYTVDDMKQEGRRFALEALSSDKYDEGRPLENFLYRHVKNRFINFKRDKYRRNDPPCKLCHNCTDKSGHPDGQFCAKYLSWKKRNMSKQNILNPLDITNISDENESRTRQDSTVVQDIEYKEMLATLDEKLPMELRGTYLLMLAGEHVSKSKREEVERAVLAILDGEILCQNAEL